MKSVERKTSPVGLSLLEIVISTALLSGAFFLFASFVGQALRGTADSGEMVDAINLANAELNRLQDLATAGTWADLLAQDGSQIVLDGFQVRVSVKEQQSYSPSRSAEQPFESTNRHRSFSGGVAVAAVDVRRENLRTSQTRLLQRGRRQLGNPPIEILGLPGSPLARDQTATVTARLVADNGEVIPALFEFHQIPGSGNGSLTYSSNGREASFQNATTDSSGTTIYTGGDCRLRVKTSYFGQTYTVDSGLVNLAP